MHEVLRTRIIFLDRAANIISAGCSNRKAATHVCWKRVQNWWRKNDLWILTLYESMKRKSHGCRDHYLYAPCQWTNEDGVTMWRHLSMAGRIHRMDAFSTLLTRSCWESTEVVTSIIIIILPIQQYGHYRGYQTGSHSFIKITLTHAGVN